MHITKPNIHINHPSTYNRQHKFTSSKNTFTMHTTLIILSLKQLLTHNFNIPRHNIHQCQPYQPILALPPSNKTYIGKFFHITHPHLNIPKVKLAQYYTWDNTAHLIMSGDIQTNRGPTPHILNNLLQAYTKRQRQYFISNKKPQLSILINRHTQQHLLILQCGHIHPNLGYARPTKNTPHRPQKKTNNIFPTKYDQIPTGIPTPCQNICTSLPRLAPTICTNNTLAPILISLHTTTHKPPPHESLTHWSSRLAHL